MAGSARLRRGWNHVERAVERADCPRSGLGHDCGHDLALHGRVPAGLVHLAHAACAGVRSGRASLHAAQRRDPRVVGGVPPGQAVFAQGACRFRAAAHHAELG
eukprot:scaffold69_cov248-Pinguiococcus_pyrenoidosus.AAC.44